jgi:hypothetical protein
MPHLTTPSLQGGGKAVRDLGRAEIDAMHALMTAHYHAVPRELFEGDLTKKDEVLLLHDAAGRLRGFTTLAWNPAGEFAEGDLLFSGDTIIDRECWGTQELVRAFCRHAGAWKRERARPLFWLLISKGHRTFLYLPLFAHRFHPHPEREEGEWGGIASRAAAAMFGAAWRPEQGVIRFPGSHGHLREAIAGPGDRESRNPMVRFFLERNPDYRDGVELLCLTEMSETNLKRGALAAFREGSAMP